MELELLDGLMCHGLGGLGFKKLNLLRLEKLD